MLGHAVGNPELDLKWMDDLEMAKLFLRLQFYTVKRSGLVRVINACIHLVALPLFLLNLLGMVLTFLLVFLIAKLRSKLFGKRGGDADGALMTDLTKLISKMGVLNYLPWAFLLRVIEALRRRFDNRSAIVYLRPFKMDNRMAFVPPGLPKFEIETIIQHNLERIGPVMALGANRGPLSRQAPRIDVAGQQWQPKVSALLDKCGYIVIIPADTPGTLWELDQIVGNPDYLYKSIFLNIGSAGRDHPYWNRQREVYSYDDGVTFLNALLRIARREADTLPPLEQIICAFFVGRTLTLICSRQTREVGAWGFSPKMAIYLKLHPAGHPTIPDTGESGTA
jgi:hypothetical protein